MRCGRAERLLVADLDALLDARARRGLERHLELCPRCRRAQDEYSQVHKALAVIEPVPPRPYFWERLRTRLEAEEANGRWAVYQHWALRAIPLAVAAALLILGVSLLVTPPAEPQLSASESLLLRNANPLTETQTILEARRLEERSMMLIFASNMGGGAERGRWP